MIQFIYLVSILNTLYSNLKDFIQKKGLPAYTQQIPFPGLTTAKQYVVLALPFSRCASSMLFRIKALCTYLSKIQFVKLMIFLFQQKE